MRYVFAYPSELSASLRDRGVREGPTSVHEYRTIVRITVGFAVRTGKRKMIVVRALSFKRFKNY